MTGEVQALRRHRNFLPDTAIADVARAVRSHVEGQAFDRAPAGLPAEAAEFWAVSD